MDKREGWCGFGKKAGLGWIEGMGLGQMERMGRMGGMVREIDWDGCGCERPGWDPTCWPVMLCSGDSPHCTIHRPASDKPLPWP